MSVNEKLTAVADAIRAKTGKTDLLTLDTMPTEITTIKTGFELPEEPFVTGDCYRMFRNWDWFINECGNRIVTKDIEDASCMFPITIEYIPFELNFYKYTNANFYHDISGIFSSGSTSDGSTMLKNVPKMNNCKPEDIGGLFRRCGYLREIPEDIESWFDWSYIEQNDADYGGNNGVFDSCYSLRSAPVGLLAHSSTVTNPAVAYSNFAYAFCNCCSLDEIIGLSPNIHLAANWNQNRFSKTFDYCSRLKNMTFATDNGAPYVVNWANQVIDLSLYIGYVYFRDKSYITGYNSGITADKEVTNSTTYQALKNDPDWWTQNVAYSRYNHDSAVATINSLPDTSAYLATASGTNTIKFTGAAGSATDGGAINTLTEEEIAVATAKGWTVAF